jgi:serine/threonine-protein kinase SRPK3
MQLHRKSYSRNLKLANIFRTQSLRDIYVKEGYNLMNLNIALSDWGVASFINTRLTEEIQPLLLRTPGVLLSAPW